MATITDPALVSRYCPTLFEAAAHLAACGTPISAPILAEVHDVIKRRTGTSPTAWQELSENGYQIRFHREPSPDERTKPTPAAHPRRCVVDDGLDTDEDDDGYTTKPTAKPAPPKLTRQYCVYPDHRNDDDEEMDTTDEEEADASAPSPTSNVAVLHNSSVTRRGKVGRHGVIVTAATPAPDGSFRPAFGTQQKNAANASSSLPPDAVGVDAQLVAGDGTVLRYITPQTPVTFIEAVNDACAKYRIEL